MDKAKPNASGGPVFDLRWRQLTWDDLDGWAGGRSVSRGRTYQRQGRVEKLAISTGHRLLATVIGRQRYTVSVRLNESDEHDEDGTSLTSTCTCPVGSDGCKHAVAVVAEFLQRLNHGPSIPLADAGDPRWAKLENDDADSDEDDEELDEPDRDDDSAAHRPRNKRSGWDEKIAQHIRAKSREELAELVCSLVERFPELRDEFRERIALGEGDVDRLIAQARKEIRRVTAEEAWRNGWTGDGNLPDYSKIKHRLERLADMGHADAVVRLGRELLELGMEQVGRSHDEGETATELGGCLSVLFPALAKSGLTPAQKLLFGIDALLQDDYGVIGDSADLVMDAEYTSADWSTVADELLHRLTGKSSNRRQKDDADEDDVGDFSCDYHRDHITDWIGRALAKAGRSDELLATYEAEARRTNSYERLVRYLIERKRDEDATRWATEGIARTAAKWPGIASKLAEQLCEIARKNKRWDVVAAHAAHRFFESPSPDAFNQLIAAAGKADCANSVRTIALRYLETGKLPGGLIRSKQDKRRAATGSDWPLPSPEYLLPLQGMDPQQRDRGEPRFDVLIDMAIADKRPGDALQWYDQWQAKPKSSRYAYGWSGVDGYADRIAEAVASSSPQRTVEIYRAQIERNLQQASTGAYETVASYLRKLRPVLQSVDREDEWAHLIQQVRERYRNRPRLMETLERLERRPIVSPRRARR